MNKLLTRFVSLLVIIITLSSALAYNTPKAQAIDRNNLCNDADFINYNTLDAAGIQAFLVSKGSFLKNYSQNGKSAAQIIYNASRSNRINPYAILAMIQKEEGLITGTYARSLNQTRLEWAMGYGYTDSEILTNFRGFTNQIENGSWQLRRNYDYWASNGSRWNVGKTMVIDGTSIRFGNRCTSSLYRYTPHLGTNFTTYFNLWNKSQPSGGSYDTKKLSQSRTRVLKPGQQFTIYATFRNTGTATWYKTGTNATHLGNWGPMDRNSVFEGNQNIRTELTQSQVRPGRAGVFRMTLTAPSQPGVYTETFRVVTEQIAWHGEEISWSFQVQGVNGAQTSNVSGGTNNAQFISQRPYRTYNLNPGQRVMVWATFRNTGTATWGKTGSNATHLGNWGPMDRNSVFEGNQNIRMELVQNVVPPGKIGTFRFYLTAPSQSGVYVEKFRVVTEHIAWHGDEMNWTFNVR